MPINHYDLQKFAGVKIKDAIRKKGSPDRFGKASTGDKQNDDGKPSLVAKLLKQHTEPK
ncbi:hypothetical protein [Jeongeupia chitinilytica]|uniref:Uncharacterized protein n=1 Tax=Jeongeupia chitinilytica TaxID=1041641 RepID=A0ABQ3GW94_9NEIS|nr:hypothetical protein [Jeongeupia chitinilytica]GHD55392.1 hypothetical protein GCM10007350_00990 [Jeongeupia chitinilytica]